jgi:hypothetical protein
MIFDQSSQESKAALETLSPSEQVMPRYGGRSIANIPPTIGHLLGATQGWVSPPLAPPLLDLIDPDVERVMLLVVDGIGWYKVQAALASEGLFAESVERYRTLLAAITSVAPSTTSAATTVLLSNGATPVETGMLGYSHLLPEKDLVANMLFWKPAWDPEASSGELERWGVRPETFLVTPSLAQVLNRYGIDTTALLPRQFTKSPLSRLQLRGARVRGYLNLADLWLQMRAWLEEKDGQRAFAYAYYHEFDDLSHKVGPDAQLWEEMWHGFAFYLERFFRSLSQKAGERTLLLVTADHGHISTPLAYRRRFQDHQELLRLSTAMPGGEPRHIYLYARSGQKSAMIDYAREHLGRHFLVVNGDDAFHVGLYGDPSRAHPESSRRLGDVILLPQGRDHLWDESLPRSLRGMHGGLVAEEMLVPLIAFRPDLG